ncbi:oxidoreductase [Ruania alkalisoli]|uniref:Oxidoreductase n=1 Tax=Ruania alkalisoli TaxID=2779775 RepID=A0A7M1SS73_9MICO|nr:oxidoreductase [Ruania alkalisoli]QOR70311.1 oxidoreductase [Ruania alkalisoli]
MNEKVALVTGASSGIGEAVARRLAEQGYVTYGAARRTDRMRPLAAVGIRTLSLDVTDEDSTRDAVGQILAETGRLDVLVNNAGYGSYGAIEDVPIDEARRQFEVNVFGAMRLVQLVAPTMREQRSGRIVNISSMGGEIYTPLGGWYHGTKFALEGLSDCLRLELGPFGVDVVVVQPGGIRSEWGTIAAENVVRTSGSGPYARQASAVAGMLAASGERDSSPDVVADAVERAVTATRPRTRYAIGFGAKPLIGLRRVLPDRAFDALVRRMATMVG